MKSEKKKTDKIYHKPELRKIELKADEVLAPGCKSDSTGSSAGAPPPCLAGSCAGIGTS